MAEDKATNAILFELKANNKDLGYKLDENTRQTADNARSLKAIVKILSAIGLAMLPVIIKLLFWR